MVAVHDLAAGQLGEMGYGRSGRTELPNRALLLRGARSALLGTAQPYVSGGCSFGRATDTELVQPWFGRLTIVGGVRDAR